MFRRTRTPRRGACCGRFAILDPCLFRSRSALCACGDRAKCRGGFHGRTWQSGDSRARGSRVRDRLGRDVYEATSAGPAEFKRARRASRQSHRCWHAVARRRRHDRRERQEDGACRHRPHEARCTCGLAQSSWPSSRESVFSISRSRGAVTGFDTPFPYYPEMEYMPMAHRSLPAIVQTVQSKLSSPKYAGTLSGHHGTLGIHVPDIGEGSRRVSRQWLCTGRLVQRTPADGQIMDRTKRRSRDRARRVRERFLEDERPPQAARCHGARHALVSSRGSVCAWGCIWQGAGNGHAQKTAREEGTKGRRRRRWAHQRKHDGHGPRARRGGRAGRPASPAAAPCNRSSTRSRSRRRRTKQDGARPELRSEAGPPTGPQGRTTKSDRRDLRERRRRQ